MDGDCGSVSMADYWNNIATPYFFIVLGFCLFFLFKLSDISLAPKSVVDMIRLLPPPHTARPAAPAASPRPAAPAASPRPAAPAASPRPVVPKIKLPGEEALNALNANLQRLRNRRNLSPKQPP